MSIHIFTRFRRAITLMVLLAIFAALLPMQGAAADLTFPLTKEETNSLFLNWYLEHISKGSSKIRVEKYIVSNLINNVSLPTTEMTEQLEALNARYYNLLGPRAADPEYRKSLPPAELSRVLYYAAAQTPAFRDAVVTAYRELKQRYDEFDTIDNGDIVQAVALKAASQDNALTEALRTLLNEQDDKARERAKTDPEFAKLWDKHILLDDDLSIKDFETVKFLAEHPEVPVPQEIRDAVNPDGTMEISLADLEKLAKGEFTTINASIDDIQKTLVEISTTQGELVDFMNDQKKRQAAQDKAKAKIEQHQLKLAAANSTVSIVSTLVSLKYPERGRQIAVVGGALVKIYESISGWLQATSGQSGLSKIGSLSTVVMTGNVLAAVMNIVSLFGPQQPTPEQLILEEIGKLRQQVSELRVEMHTRFDQIDTQLVAIHNAMNDRFNLIDLQLGKINGNLAEIQQSLLTLQLSLNRMERNNVEYLDALGRRPLREAMNGALGYKERTGLDMPYQPEFVEYENIFHSWGTINAFDALSAGPSQRDYSDAQVLAELSAAPLDANVNYLNGWLSAHGMAPFAAGRLPSPRDWAFASRAYAELGLDWPQHLQRIGAQRQAALDAVGSDLEQAMTNISTIQTPSGPQGNAPLWSGLTDYYNAKLQGLDGALQASEAAFVNEVQAALKRSTPFELYGGLDQSLAYPHQPDDFTTMTCGGQSAAESRLAAPHNLKNVIASYNRFALADYLRVSPLTVCVNAGWINLDPPYPAGPGTCDRYGEVMVALVVVADHTASLVRHSVVGPRRLYSDANIWSIIAPEWTTYWKRSFELNFQGRTPPPLTPEAAKVFETVSSATAIKLGELQRAHASQVRSGLGQGQLGASAVELAGAKKLLESFVTLGFPQAVSNDDFLRSLLFSKEAIIDDQQIAISYAPPPPTLSATAAISEAQLLLNPRVKLLETAQKRHDALAKLLTDYLGSISTEVYREDIALVAGARFDMQLARAFADPNAPLPGQSRVIFLPLVVRQ